MDNKSFNFSSWLKEGFILQTGLNVFILGEGPFKPSSSPCRGFYKRDFFLKNSSSWWLPHKMEFFSRKEVEDFLYQGDKSPCFTKSKKPSFIEFQKVFHEVKNKINQKQLYKAVPVFFEELETIPDVKLYLQKLFYNTREKASQGFIYGYWNNQEGMIGFTPEILFSVKGKKFKTMALAGTSPLHLSLLNDSKEIKEQHFVLQDIKESLQGLVKWKKEQSYEKLFFNIKHICTDIEGELVNAFDFSYFCDKLHPTAALGGYPKSETFIWLKKHSTQTHRGSFGAPFGFFDGKDQSFCIVAIRGIQWKKEKSYIGSGCGLISESVLEKEWEELSLKREQIKNLFK